MFFTKAHAATLPIQGTDIAASWDHLYDFLLWLSVFFFVLVVGAMIYFAVKYRHRPGFRPKYITGHHLLEAIWIFVPTVLLMVIFGWGYWVYHGMTQAPLDAYEIRVIGKQWLWQFQYDNGRTTVNELFAPLGKPVKLVMTSEDVLHSFFVPNFRIKQDVVPGMYTSVWFEAKVPGKHQVYCTEYCGTSHSGMLAKLVVLDEQQWQQWYSGRKLGEIPDAADGAGQLIRADARKPAPELTDEVRTAQARPVELSVLARQGKHFYETKGCVACHSADGTAKAGPSFKGVYGRKVEFITGAHAVADDNYLRESIELPNARVVKGFQPVMPAFKGLVSETEMNALIAYIRSLK
jgi:cytochrome c oxidase subunit II